MTMKTFKRGWVPLLLAACFGAAVAAPTGQQVVAGQATFNQQGSVFSITNTPGTIINWQSFSIGLGETTRFIQQSADSAVLNRIVGQDPSRILGALQSNGKVFLINPNGIMFGQGARVDVNGLVASTLNLSDADFLAGKKKFSAGAVAGEVRNDGAITTPSGGQVYLIAPNVTNAGVITSPQGEVVLAAGHSVQLVDSRDPDLHVVVSAPSDQSINLGQVVAQGGRVGIYGALVNQRGVVNANSAQVGENGKIVLKATRDTVLEQGSVTSATGAGAGGDVHLLGQRVALNGDAAVDASGAAGGGNVLVGGGWQGKDASLPNASQTWLGKDASIKADAIGTGNGGQVVLWSNDATAAYGSISARGGAQGGDGGKVETSGHNLDVSGVRVNASAGKGKAGTWLLDPYDIEVTASGATASVGDVAQFTSGLLTGLTKISPAVLAASGSDIVLRAQNDLTITDAISGGAGVNASAAHDVNVNANVTSTNGSVLFSAGSNIRLASGATIKSNSYIDLIADHMTLAGNIGGAGVQLPVVTFTTSTPGQQIQVTSSANSSALSLDPAALGRFSAYEINLGTSGNTGGVYIFAPLSLSGSLAIDSSGAVAVSAPVRLGSSGTFMATLRGDQGMLLDVNNAITANSVYLTGDGLRISAPITATTVQLMPHTVTTPISLGGFNEGSFNLDASMLGKISATDLKIGGLPGYASLINVVGAVDLSGHSFAKLTLDAGEGALTFGAPFTMPSGVLALKSNQIIGQDATSPLNVDKLALTGGNVALPAANTIGTLAGTAGSGVFAVNAAGGLHIGDAGGISGLTTGEGQVSLSSNGALVLDRGITATDGTIAMNVAGVTGSGKLTATSLFLDSTAGIGSTTAPLNTQVQLMHVTNNQSGSRSINIANTGDLQLIGAYQNGADPALNTGAITIKSTGALTLTGNAIQESISEGTNSAQYGGVRTQAGAITLAAATGMLIDGTVVSSSGDISLSVPNGSFTVGSNGHVASNSGAIGVVAATTTIPAGSITSVSGKVSLPGAVTPPPVTPPTLAQCAANPSSDACTPVIEDARRACLSNPAAPYCAQVMPSLDACKISPSAIGCNVVLQEEAVKQCTVHPEAASCGGAVDFCAANPATPSCDVLAQKRKQIDTCVANPKAAGCATVLPTYEACAAAPGTYGCGPAVTEHNAIQACVTDPSGPACQAVLPKYETCSAAPSTFGCAPVVAKHDAVQACLAKVSDPACASVLPTVSACSADTGIFGCSAVLARQQFLSCVANPAASSCDAILPPLATCKATPAQEGCSSVIAKTFDFCLTNPSDARCSGILPTISQCIGDKTAAGCAVVLPKLATCAANPTQQGCSVVLPPLASCKATPSLEGCATVIKSTFDACLVNPNDARCSGILPTISQCVSDRNQAGCSVVLPTLAQCVGSPTLQGCSVILPTLAQCAAGPSVAGCEAVLPKPDFCATHPTDPTCQVFAPTQGNTGGDGKQVGQAVQATVTLVNTTTVRPGLGTASTVGAGPASGTGTTAPGTGLASSMGSGASADGSPDKPADKPAEKPAGPAATENTGAKNEKPATKTYCN
jgi:filamentous hemagglutinin family protein